MLDVWIGCDSELAGKFSLILIAVTTRIKQIHWFISHNDWLLYTPKKCCLAKPKPVKEHQPVHLFTPPKKYVVAMTNKRKDERERTK